MQASVRTDPELSDFHAAIQPVATGCLNGPFATGSPILFRYAIVALKPLADGLPSVPGRRWQPLSRIIPQPAEAIEGPALL